MSSEATEILRALEAGDPSAADRLLPLVYAELRGIAARQLRHEGAGHTLQPTALVHEAYLRLIEQRSVSWENRAHFFSVAAHIMRNILVDHAVKRKTQKRDFGQRIELTEDVSFTGGRDVDLLALTEAMDALDQIEPVQAKLVELRFFAGLSIEETAHVLKISPATVKREWAIAKTWLYRRLKSE